MGRSAKLMKRPTKKEKDVKKTVSSASKPIVAAPPAPVSRAPPQQAQAVNPAAKRRKTLRARADKVDVQNMKPPNASSQMDDPAGPLFPSPSSKPASDPFVALAPVARSEPVSQTNRPRVSTDHRSNSLSFVDTLDSSPVISGTTATMNSTKQTSSKQKSNPNSNSNAGGNSSGNASGKSGPLTIRKQNVACDACRRSKIRCVRTAGVDKCDMCMSKNIMCTAHYVTSLAAKERKKPSGQSTSRNRASSGSLGQVPTDKQKQRKRKAVEVVQSEDEEIQEDDGSSDSQIEPASENQSASHSKTATPQIPSRPELYSSSSDVNYPPSMLYPVDRQLQPYLQPYRQSSASALSLSSSLSPAAVTVKASNTSSLLADFDPYHKLSTIPQHNPNTTTNPSSSSRKIISLHSHASNPSQLSHLVSIPPSPLSTPTDTTVSPVATPARLPPSITNLLLYMFSPTRVKDTELDYSDTMVASLSERMAQLLKDKPTKAHLSLNDPALRIELAKDLIESFIMIVRIRLPLIDPELIRSQLDPDESNNRSSVVWMAPILAHGARFSEHQIIINDREETTLLNAQRDRRETGRTRSRLVSLLTARAQEVLEVHRIYRTASLENVQAALLMEGLVNLKPVVSNREDKAHTKLFWTSVAIQHLIKLRCNHKNTVAALQSGFTRQTIQVAWWSACFTDAYHATYWRTKPCLQDQDYNTYPLLLPDDESTPMQGVEPNHYVWYHASNAHSQICRQMYLDLFTPDKEQNGVPLDAIQNLMGSLQNWRSGFLSKVGVPGGWPDSWDFLAAVTACTLDTSYHVLWIRLIRAVEDFGIKEDLQAKQAGVLADPAVRVVWAMLSSEAMHAANRISALSAVLSQNGYLRLDPNTLHHPIVEAGTYLAQHGCPSFQSCVTGLRQYGMSYEGCYDEADMIQEMYERAFRQKPMADDDNGRKGRASGGLESLADHTAISRSKQASVEDDTLFSDRTIQYLTGHPGTIRFTRSTEKPDGSIGSEAPQATIYRNTDPKLYPQSYVQSQTQSQSRSSPIQEVHNVAPQIQAQTQAPSPTRSRSQVVQPQTVSQQAAPISSHPFQSSYPHPPSSYNGLY